MKTYKGNIEITSDNCKEWQKKLKGVEKISGYLSINSQAKLEAKSLESVGGDLSIHSPIARRTNELINRLLKEKKERKYYINNINFEKEMFNKVRKDKLSAQEVFELKNIEQRRVAYECMDKLKMKKLKGFKVIHKAVDKDKNKMEIASFKMQGFGKEFLYFHCVCPSTGREYFLETKYKKCQEAKSGSFGLLKISFVKEY